MRLWWRRSGEVTVHLAVFWEAGGTACWGWVAEDGAEPLVSAAVRQAPSVGRWAFLSKDGYAHTALGCHLVRRGCCNSTCVSGCRGRAGRVAGQGTLAGVVGQDSAVGYSGVANAARGRNRVGSRWLCWVNRVMEAGSAWKCRQTHRPALKQEWAA